MTDRERQLIEAYLPHPRDPELRDGEYYVKDSAFRVHKVEIRTIFPGDIDGAAEYDCYEVSTGNRIDPGWGSPWRGFRKCYLYDNRQDCKDWTHEMYDGWEHLRVLQQKEAEG